MNPEGIVRANARGTFRAFDCQKQLGLKWRKSEVFVKVQLSTIAQNQGCVCSDNTSRTHITQKTPAHWVKVGDWPLTSSGKIQKFVLRERFVKGEFVEVR